MGTLLLLSPDAVAQSHFGNAGPGLMEWTPARLGATTSGAVVMEAMGILRAHPYNRSHELVGALCDSLPLKAGAGNAFGSLSLLAQEECGGMAAETVYVARSRDTVWSGLRGGMAPL
jgi:hypothetical protein